MRRRVPRARCPGRLDERWGGARLAPIPCPGPPPPPALPVPASPGGRIGHLEFGPGVRAAAPAAAAAAACWSPLVSNSLHGYSLYGGGGGGGGSSSSSRRPPRAARPPRLGGALLPATVTRLHAPPLQRPAHARLQRAREGRAKGLAASHWLDAVPVRKGVPREEEEGPGLSPRGRAGLGGAWREARGLAGLKSGWRAGDAG